MKKTRRRIRVTIHIPRGTQDILPGDSERWQYIERKAQEMSARYNYREVRTPVFEATELFHRSVGDTTDIVQKEMYTFEDQAGRSLTLRPEGTASIVRSFVENKLFGQPQQPTKLFYIGPMFRYERPESGRLRQFVQFGIEAIGSADPAIDAEVMAFAMSFYKELGLKKIKLVLNSLGDVESRKAHRQALIEHFKPRIGEFCSDCQTRLETNPLRILDCKVDRGHELIETAPSILDYLNESSRAYFESVQEHLTAMNIPFEVDETLVRGLDYYQHTAFEIMSEADGFGANTTLSGGGRYNGLVEELGGPETPGIGFAMSIERLLLALEAEQVTLPTEHKLDCYVVAIGDAPKTKTVSILQNLRLAGFKADKDYLDRKPKGQFKSADRLGAKYVAVLGDDELTQNVINVKDMNTGEQEAVAIDELVDYIKTKQSK